MARRGLDSSQLPFEMSLITEDFDFLNPRNRAIGEETVTYGGSLEISYDVESVKFAAKRHPNGIFCSWPGGERGNPPASVLPNVHLRGEVPYRNLRHYFRVRQRLHDPVPPLSSYAGD